MQGVKVDHATIQRWVFKFTPLLETKFRTREGKVEGRWRMDETYVKVKGKWMRQNRKKSPKRWAVV